MLKQDDHGHGEKSVHRTGDAGESAALPVFAFKRDGKENEAVDNAAAVFFLQIKAGLAATESWDFIIGQLEEELHLLPLFEASRLGCKPVFVIDLARK